MILISMELKMLFHVEEVVFAELRMINDSSM
jgi:hypothetical protein